MDEVRTESKISAILRKEEIYGGNPCPLIDRTH